MARWKGTTTERGLGAEHVAARKATPKPNGEPCPFPYCGHAPMYADQPLDFDHAIPRVLGGTAASGRWAHRSCNRKAGAALGNKLRRYRRPPDWNNRWA